jgi:hypothetical protein
MDHERKSTARRGEGLGNNPGAVHALRSILPTAVNPLPLPQKPPRRGI